jgi:hypothetical protein
MGYSEPFGSIEEIADMNLVRRSFSIKAAKARPNFSCSGVQPSEGQ